MATTDRRVLARPHDTEWMTLQEAALYICVSVKTIRRHIAAGNLPAYLCGKRGLRVRPTDLDELMTQLR